MLLFQSAQPFIVSFAAILWDVVQLLLDIPKDGCEGDLNFYGWFLIEIYPLEY